MAEGLGWFHLAWCLTCSCFTFSRICMRFKKSCLLHFNSQWKQDQLIFWLLHTTTAQLAEVRGSKCTNQSMSKTCLLCSSRILFAFETLNSKSIWTHLLDFIRQIWNKISKSNWTPMLWVYASKLMICANWRTRSNCVRPEPGGGGGVLLYISYIGMCRTLGYGFRAVLGWNRVWFLPF